MLRVLGADAQRPRQALQYDLFHLRLPFEGAEEKLKSIIERHPYAFDAYDRLAYVLHYVTGRPKETIELLGKGLARAKELFPKEFTLGKSNLPWGIVENRPFYRMYKTLD